MARASRRPVRNPDDVATQLHSAAIHLLRRLRREDVHAGLSGPRASALSVIVFGGPITLGALAAAEQVRPPTMTRLVKALEAQGLVRREEGAHDRRETLLHATPRGRELLHRGRDRRVRRLAAHVARLSAAELTTLADATAIMQRLLQALAADESPGAGA
jgi:DNA-binding MarR family transcriptional regulator